MSWDYAELSKAAKNAGGPEKLMDMLVESGKDAGHKEMLPLVGIALGIGALGYAGIQKLIKFFKKKEEISPEAVASAREELIQGIKDYDATHPDGEDTQIEKEDSNDDKDGNQ